MQLWSGQGWAAGITYTDEFSFVLVPLVYLEAELAVLGNHSDSLCYNFLSSSHSST